MSIWYISFIVRSYQKGLKMNKTLVKFSLIFFIASIGLGITYYLLMRAINEIPLGCTIEAGQKGSQQNLYVSGVPSVVEIYTLPHCGFCTKAKALLNKRGIKFTEFDVSFDPLKRQQMLERSEGRRTVPQIFIHKRHIGGYEDLKRADNEGKLEGLKSGAPAE